LEVPLKYAYILALAALSMSFAVSSTSLACGGGIGWAKPTDSTPKVTTASVISKVSKTQSVEIQKSKAESMCGDDYDYFINDAATKKYLGSVPVPRSADRANDGRYLDVRLQQILSVPREQLLALGGKGQVFYDDTEALEKDLGFSAYVPDALPIEQRYLDADQSYLVYLTIEKQCSANGYESPGNVVENFPIKTIEFIPGRTDYSANTIYQKGDLKKAILANPKIMDALKKRVASNVQYCRDSDLSGKRDLWAEVSKRLATESTQQLLETPAQRLSDTKSSPASAYMLNKNVISIKLSDGSEKDLAGTVDEMVDLQKQLSRSGIVVDKSSQLDFEGKIQIETDKDFPNYKVPASLQN
jgi:hypothetical protein